MLLVMVLDFSSTTPPLTCLNLLAHLFIDDNFIGKPMSVRVSEHNNCNLQGTTYTVVISLNRIFYVGFF